MHMRSLFDVAIYNFLAHLKATVLHLTDSEHSQELIHSPIVTVYE